MDTRVGQLRSFRFALLASLGFPLGCGGETRQNQDVDPENDASLTGSTRAGVDASTVAGVTIGGVTTGSVAATSGFSGPTGFTASGGTSSGGLVGGSGGVTSVATTTGTPLPLDFSCTQIGERLVSGFRSGFIECEEGFEVREQPISCPNLLPVKGTGGAAGAQNGVCSVDADCPGPLEYCRPESGAIAAGCVQGCLTDQDCGAGYVCRCEDPIGKCALATCQTNADCPGSWCASLRDDTCLTTYSYTCLGPNDQCVKSADCGELQCLLVPSTNVRRCGQADCGRPFLVAARQRMAGITTRSDWSAELEVATSELTAAERQKLARHWQQIGLMEHASIAAFARFALQLLSLGAPAALVEAAQEALADETRHARLAFGLASAYGQKPLGPGPLVTADALVDSSLETIVRTAIKEGCIGETVAAMEARVASEQCADPVVRSILASIADDEARHAELAWHFLAYCLEYEPTLFGLVQACFNEVGALEGAKPDAARELDFRRYGLIADSERQLLRQEVLSQVVMPCAATLLQEAANAAQPAESAPQHTAHRV